MHLPDHIKTKVRRAPRYLRDDAMQEAWLAMLEGRDPDKALSEFFSSERSYRAKYKTNFDMDEFESPLGKDDIITK